MSKYHHNTSSKPCRRIITEVLQGRCTLETFCSFGGKYIAVAYHNTTQKPQHLRCTCLYHYWEKQ